MEPKIADYLEGADEIMEAEQALSSGGGLEAGIWLVYVRTRYAKAWFYLSEADEIAQLELRDGKDFADVKRHWELRQKSL